MLPFIGNLQWKLFWIVEIIQQVFRFNKNALIFWYYRIHWHCLILNALFINGKIANDEHILRFLLPIVLIIFTFRQCFCTYDWQVMNFIYFFDDCKLKNANNSCLLHNYLSTLKRIKTIMLISMIWSNFLLCSK